MNQFLSKTILQCRTKSFLLGWTQARLRSTLTSAALKTAAPTSAGRAKVECYPNTPAIKVQLLPVNAGERITMTQNLGQPLPRYQAFLCDGMLEVDSTAFMDYMEENDLGYIVDYKRYNADVFTGVNRRTAAVFQFHSAALRRLNKVGCQRYEGDYTRLKQKHAERRARRMAG